MRIKVRMYNEIKSVYNDDIEGNSEVRHYISKINQFVVYCNHEKNLINDKSITGDHLFSYCMNMSQLMVPLEKYVNKLLEDKVIDKVHASDRETLINKLHEIQMTMLIDQEVCERIFKITRIDL